MSTLLSILPLLGSLASIVLGLIGLIRPAFFMRVTDLQPTSPKGKLEMRAIFGGCLIALGLVCLVTAAPAAYLLAGLLWLSSATVKLALMRLDKVPLRTLLTGLAGDLPIGLAMLSGFWTLKP
ncbi:MAG TPA: hypothetical protein P5279_07400 [Anaerohalosphaeraceae bacterium]|jgi:hypothetical protein|nr:hypothetical protein [Anaerohalosphaeraceae bacterium]HRT50301.1 hypothetical protein [Anaerohalosphaeraceae bacterium]HRT86179.1 hypothetical protein [Anaerohalosphaeraceae bacterium]